MSITPVSLAKPSYLFGRDEEWADLSQFVASNAPGVRLALVYGRRRQGKTMLLEALCQATGGFLWQARQQSGPQNLRELERAIGRFTGSLPRLSTWDDAVEALFTLTSGGPDSSPHLPVVIDEVGYLLDADPAFASRIQAALAPVANRRRGSSARVILCGSAFGRMRRLVDAGAPLRGRADLEVVLRPFGYRESAAFWNVDGNPDLAFRLHALVGGTPAYNEYGGGGPHKGDLDGWAVSRLLSSASPLFREGRVVVGEDPSLNDRALYWAVIGAIADGAAGRAEVTSALGRPSTSLHKALANLVEAGWIRAERDPLRRRGTRFILDEPIVRLHRLVIEPAEVRLTRRGAASAVWQDAQPLVRSRIYGPHLEYLAREWVLHLAEDSAVGGRPFACGPATVGRGSRRMELDLLATTVTPAGAIVVCAVGEAKATREAIGVRELARLDAAVELLGPEQVSAEVRPQRVLVARSGFTRELEATLRRRPDVTLVDLVRLYGDG